MPYIGEIRLWPHWRPPAGWAYCDGQAMPISENEGLFYVLGTRYGGDGQETFNLPDLRGRVPIHQGNGYVLASTGGAESVTLTVAQIPAHTHPMLGAGIVGNSPNPTGNMVAESSAMSLYQSASPTIPLAASMVAPVGGSQPHDNMQPYVGIHYIISLYGEFPQPT
ncbi:MAG TPA: tail fiber protein [Allosphingosinicella sp.]|jgi:microcystin-dependent protein